MWRAATAASHSSPATTHEMRMAEVEIISMLMWLAASVSNTVAATPGLVFMPAPTSDTLAIDGVGGDAVGADLGAPPARRWRRWPRGRRRAR